MSRTPLRAREPAEIVYAASPAVLHDWRGLSEWISDERRGRRPAGTVWPERRPDRYR
jgi:hypothetical protein